MKRRGGRSNRGGGRFNHQQKSQDRSQSQNGGIGGSRKQNLDLCADDDIPLLCKSSAYEDSPKPKTHNDKILRKVPMQTLHMTKENQDIVYRMLTEVNQDDDPHLGTAAYNVLNHHDISRFWTNDNKLQIEGSKKHGTVVGARSGNLANDELFSLPLKKLQRYGFERQRCLHALTQNNGDAGASLELLLSECFDIVPCNNVDVSLEEIFEQRQEEMLALTSIYGDSFKEKIKNRVWAVIIDLPFLRELLLSKIETPPKSTKTVVARTEASVNQMCNFFRAGSCRFGSRCRYKHVLEVDPMNVNKSVNGCDVSSSEEYELEIRFPENHRYPYQCPYIAFSCTSDFLPRHCCLNMTTRLMYEAQTCLSDDAVPVVFSLVSILEDQKEWEIVFKQPMSEFSVAKPVISNSRGKKSGAPISSLCSEDDPSDDSLMSEEEELIAGKCVEPADARGSNKNVNTKRFREMKTVNFARDDLRIREKHGRIIKRDSYQNILRDRKKLPAWSMKDVIVNVIAENKVTVISGMTGCGKTTQVPQFILDSFFCKKGIKLCNIVVTQPRRISAVAVSERVAEERCDSVGGVVGYQIRLENKQSAMTRMLFCTTGILLRRLEADKDLGSITHVIIDEVHERSEDSDFLMMVMRDLLKERHDLKLILMSATLNADLFSQYFNNCPVVDIPGKTFPVEKFFLEDAIEMTGYVMEEFSPYARSAKETNAISMELEDFMDGMSISPAMKPAKDNIRDENLNVKQFFIRYAAYSKRTIKCLALADYDKINYELIECILMWIISEGCTQFSNGAVLIFLPGYAEINTLYELLTTSKTFGGQQKHKYRIIPLHSSLSTEEQHAVFRRQKEGVTKIVIATNIAETSITIDDVVFVIDCGKMKEKRFDHSKSMESLDTVWVSRANALQRSGRAGRVAAGISFHLFSRHRFDYNIRDQPVPEIQRAPLEQLTLKIKILDCFKGRNVKDVLQCLLEPPKPESIVSAIKRLHDLGALDSDEELTPLGYHLAFLPVDVRIGKLMLFGSIFRCLDPALTIAACLSFKSPFVAPFDKRDEADKKKLQFAVGHSDQLTILKAYKGWISAGKNGNHSSYCYCQENFLSIKTMQMLASLKRQFVELLSDIGFIMNDLTSKEIERIARSGGDGVLSATGEQYNINSENMHLVSAILCAALYPNVVQIMTPEARYADSSHGAVLKPPKPEELKLRTKTDGYVHIHPSSVNFQVNYYESPYLVYHEKVKTSKIYLRDCSMVTPYALVLFGGTVSVELYHANFILSVADGWIRFIAASHKVAELIRELRLELDDLLADKINDPDIDLCTCPRGSKIINTIVHVITAQH